MQISFDWLSDFVDTRGIDLPTFTRDLSVRTAEVAAVHTTGCAIPHVVVGKILAIEAVPGADKIRLTTTDVGSGEPLKIICGAQNIFVGAVVPVATIGAVLPGNFKIEKRKMKGIESHGMLCSTRELGLVGDAAGILLLPENTPLGVPLSDVLPADTVLEFENSSLTHRPDLFGQIGFAREIALILDRPLMLPTLAPLAAKADVAIDIVEPKLCPRYVSVRVSNISIKPSSEKITRRLAAVGLRAINNVVDATNYVMAELGQPMHAFDAKKVNGEIVVRHAKKGEKLVTLDGVERTLTPEMFVIADGSAAVALAGVMGGGNSEVDESTTELLLEAANFEAATVRRMSMATGLRTEASLRFEKRLDPTLPPLAVARFVELLRETCPDLIVAAYTDVVGELPASRVIHLAAERVAQKLGLAIPAADIVKILTTLGFIVTSITNKPGFDGAQPDNFNVTVPSHRAGRDIECDDDLIEEIARHYGYEKIPTVFPTVTLAPLARDTKRELVREITDALVGCGAHETCTLALTPEQTLRNSGYDPSMCARLVNPPSDDFRYLRPAVLLSLLAAALTNVRTTKEFRLFEIATAFAPAKEIVAEHDEIVLLGVEKNAYAAIHGVAERLLTSLKFASTFVPAATIAPTAHPGRVAEIRVGKKVVGHVAELHPAVAKKFDLPTAAYLTLDLAALVAIPRAAVIATSLPSFPDVPRDIAVVVPERTFAADVAAAIASADPRIAEITLFDTFVGKTLPAGTKSLAFSFVIRDFEKTLTDIETEAVVKAVVAAVEKVGGKLRA